MDSIFIHRADRVARPSEERAAFYLKYELGDGMDHGERDLFAHLLGRTNTDAVVCSPDKACVRAAVALGWGDRIVCLEELIDQVGCHPAPALKSHYNTSWLTAYRTQVILGTG